MTKQLREKLIPRRTSLLPRISSSYDGNHIEVVDTANGNNRKNNIKWIEYICKFIHVLSTIIQFCSPVVIIVALLSYDSVIVIAVAFGLCLLKILVLDLYLFKMGKIQNWPNKVSKKSINDVSYFQNISHCSPLEMTFFT
jgi:ABC-type multidrug transport system fused ATPase/permease subunit